MDDPPLRLVDARGVDAATLVELTVGLRRALLQRSEHLGPEWPEQAAEDLRRGALLGALAYRAETPVALALLSVRGDRGYGQIHIASGEGGAAIAAALFDRLTGTGTAADRSDFGVSGLSSRDEEALTRELRTRPRTEIIRRFGLIRPLDLDHPPRPAPLPVGYRFLSARAYPSEQLARLDWAAFRGSPDAAFLDESPGSARRLLEGMLAGQLGRFLDEASFTVADPTGALCGMLLTAEESPRVGVFVDLAVDPGHRRQGVGRALLARGLRGLLALGQSAGRLWVTESNVPARGLYESLGFRAEATSYIYRYRAAAGPSDPDPSPHRDR